MERCSNEYNFILLVMCVSIYNIGTLDILPFPAVQLVWSTHGCGGYLLSYDVDGL